MLHPIVVRKGELNSWGWNGDDNACQSERVKNEAFYPFDDSAHCPAASLPCGGPECIWCVQKGHLSWFWLSLLLLLDAMLIYTTDYGLACFARCGEEGGFIPPLCSGSKLFQRLFLKAWEGLLYWGQHFSAYPMLAVRVGLSWSFESAPVFFLGAFSFPNVSPSVLSTLSV